MLENPFCDMLGELPFIPSTAILLLYRFKGVAVDDMILLIKLLLLSVCFTDILGRGGRAFPRGISLSLDDPRSREVVPFTLLCMKDGLWFERMASADLMMALLSFGLAVCPCSDKAC